MDVLEPRRQAELGEILRDLETFSPDRIAVEHRYGDTASMDSLHRRCLEAPPDARDELTSRWDVRYADRDVDDPATRSLDEILVALDTDRPPGDAEMYRRFLPLVRVDVYAGRSSSGPGTTGTSGSSRTSSGPSIPRTEASSSSSGAATSGCSTRSSS